MRFLTLVLCLSSWVAAAQSADGTCTLSGRVEFAPNESADPKHRQVVVYVSKKPSKARRDETQIIDIVQQGKQFNPQLQVVQVDDELRFPNRDNEQHSVWARGLFNIKPTTQKDPEPQTMVSAGAVRLQCDIHQNMRADVLVIPVRRFHALVAADGTWKIDGLPDQMIHITAWEPNGATATREVHACQGSPTVLRLAGNKPPVTLRWNGTPYPDYPP